MAQPPSGDALNADRALNLWWVYELQQGTFHDVLNPRSKTPVVNL